MGHRRSRILTCSTSSSNFAEGQLWRCQVWCRQVDVIPCRSMPKSYPALVVPMALKRRHAPPHDMEKLCPTCCTDQFSYFSWRRIIASSILVQIALEHLLYLHSCSFVCTQIHSQAPCSNLQFAPSL